MECIQVKFITLYLVNEEDKSSFPLLTFPNSPAT